MTGTGAQAPGTTTYALNGLGQTVTATITGQTSASISYVYDASGQGIASDRTGNWSSHDDWLRFGGIEMGHFTNGVQQSVGAAQYTDGDYTVHDGDTLASIAAAAWGDAQLWYKLAEANGLTATSPLVEGQRLRIPAGVFRIHNTAQTFKPYDPAQFIGDTTPTPLSPSARKGNGCGTFGIIMLAVVAIAVTVITRLPVAKFLVGLGAPAAGGAAIGTTAGVTMGASSVAGIASAAGAAAIGSVASQGFGLATGIQSKFSFKGVALSAIGAGVGAGLGALGGAANVANDALRGALGSGITQGIGVATGLQDKFSWAGVAAAGIGAAVGGGVARGLDKNAGFFSTRFGNDLASTGAAAIAIAASRSAIEGSSFGDNLIAALPDAIGSTLGRALGGAVQAALSPERAARAQIEGNPTRASSPMGESEALFGWNPLRSLGRFVKGLFWGRSPNVTQEIRRAGQSPREGAGETVNECWDANIVVRASEWAAKQLTRFARQSEDLIGHVIRATSGSLARRGQMEIRMAQQQQQAFGIIGRSYNGWAATPITPPMVRSALHPQAFAGDGAGWGVALGFADPRDFNYVAPYTKGDRVDVGLSAVGFVAEIGLAARAASVASRAPRLSIVASAANEADFVGPLIGNSGFRTSAEFAEAFGTKYQRFVDDAYARALKLEAQGFFDGKPNTAMGWYADRFIQLDAKAYLRAEGISEGPNGLVKLDRWLRDPTGTGLYVRPDVHIPAAGHLFDATLANKSLAGNQLIRFGQFSGGDYITLYRPQAIGGSYSVVP